MNESPMIESSLTPTATSPLETLARQWMLRILVLQKGYRHFVGVDGYENNTIARFWNGWRQTGPAKRLCYAFSPASRHLTRVWS